MKVQEILLTDGRTRYVVVDKGGEWVKPVVRYLMALDGNRARNTVRANAYDLRLFFEFLDQTGLNYQDVTVEEMVGFVNWLKVPADGRAILMLPTVQARKSDTINHILTSVSGFYAHLWRTDALETDINSKLHIDLPASRRRFKGFLHHLASQSPVQAHLLHQPRTKRMPKTLTKEQIAALIAAAGNVRDRLLLRLLYDSSLRVGEALALWLEDINIVPPQLTVCDRGELVNGAEIKTPNSPRTVDVPKTLVNEIMRFVAVAHGQGVETNHIFIKLRGTGKGQPLSYPEVNDLFQRLKKKTGIDANAHMLRHSSATELWRSGWEPELLRERLGHAHYQTVVDMYVHPNMDDLQQAFEKVEERMRLPKHPSSEDSLSASELFQASEGEVNS